MINVSNAFKQELYNDNRNYLEYADITLADQTKLSLINKDFWQGGMTIEDAVSSESSFDIGSAIINKCTLVIENLDDRFSDYDFTFAEVVVYIGLTLPDDSIEKIRKGTFTVDEAKYNGSIITLSCLDNMRLFDRPYSESKLPYPTTLAQIVRNACEVCGVTLQTQTFSHSDYMVQTRPSDEATTFREVISWTAQIAGCFCRCDTLGRLELKWFDQKLLEKQGYDGGIFDKQNETVYQTGDTLNGGSFNPWDEGDTADGGTFQELEAVHHIYANYSAPVVSTDDIVITGVKVLEKNTDSENNEAISTYLSGKDGYVVSIENNDLIHGGDGLEISTWLGAQLNGFRFRKAQLSHASDPTIEAGDVGFFTDRKQNTYPIIISSTKFSTGSAQNTISAAADPIRNSAARFSAETKNYVESRRIVQQEKTDREKALEDLGKRIDESSGLYTTEQTQGDGSKIYFMHDKPSLSESMIVWKMTAEAWGVSTDGGKSYNAGMTVNGDTIVRILAAKGINADWIKTGAFEIRKDDGTILVLMDKDTKQVILRPDTFELSSGETIQSIAEDAANNKNKTFTSTPTPPYHVGDLWYGGTDKDVLVCKNSRESGAYQAGDWGKADRYIDQTAANTAAADAVNGQTQESIFNQLTNGGETQGVYLNEGKIYINANYIKSGIVSADRIDANELFSRSIKTENFSLWARRGTSPPYRYNYIAYEPLSAELLLHSAESDYFIDSYETFFNPEIFNNESGITIGKNGVGLRAIGNEGDRRLNISPDAISFSISSGNVFFGDTSLYGIGDGTVTGAISYLNSNKANVSSLSSYLPLSGGTVTGQLKVAGDLFFIDYSGTNRKPIASVTDDPNNVGYGQGGRVSHMQSNNSAIRITAQWGVVGSSYTAKNISTSASDIRLKENISNTEIKSALDLIQKIKMHSFDWKDRTEDRHQIIGFIADELEDLDSMLSVGGGYDDDGVMNIKGVDTFYLMGYVVKAIQEMSDIIDTQNKKISDLEERIERLEKLVGGEK